MEFLETLVKCTQHNEISSQESRDIKEFGFKKTQICDIIKQKLDRLENCYNRSDRLTIIEDVFSYTSSPEILKFVHYFDEFKIQLEKKMIEIYKEEQSRVLYSCYRKVFNKRISFA